ncbi:SpoIIAA-like [Modicisalibacter muralis]|uniref:SpoIIAA-like n=1 Tax=Modicisalibacter muralis TaxID=119000 RepID=A0A1G9F448_9GAMM|nr:STAS/SEC14 domain-containing protein [Halomonas muralis]SDK83120.1 SpoIIAA-like [Halomonas muralis]
MLELIAAPAAHVVAMRASGRVNATELQRAIDAIEHAKQAHAKVSLYAEVDAMRWLTATALLRDLGYGLTQLGQLSHFHRAAVVTDRHWIRPIATLENQLFRPFEVRVFTNAEKQSAMEWVCELPNTAHSEAMA